MTEIKLPVSVKALEWNTTEDVTQNTTGCVAYKIEHFEGGGFGVYVHGYVGKGHFDTLAEAKAAAQADYEQRILSALVAAPDPVTDEAVSPSPVSIVGGDEAVIEKSFTIEWIAAPRPPAHPNPMTGRQTFRSFYRAVQHMRSQANDAKFVSLTEHTLTTVTVDRSSDLRAALASTEGAEG